MERKEGRKEGGKRRPFEDLQDVFFLSCIFNANDRPRPRPALISHASTDTRRTDGARMATAREGGGRDGRCGGIYMSSAHTAHYTE